MTNIVLNGCNGRMGRTIIELAKSYKDLKIVAGIDKFSQQKADNLDVYADILDYKGECDVVLDFSNPNSLPGLLEYCKDRNVPLVLCTTGFTEEDLKLIEQSSKTIAIFRSANMSLGVNILSSILKKISPMLFNDFDIEIVEKHHNQKLDSPSGTALLLANAIKGSLDEVTNFVYGREGIKKREKNEIGIHAVRGGSIVGEHEVIFAGKGETIEIKHSAQSREVFAVGALKACDFMKGKRSGLFNMEHVLNL